jgi:hypothetical protein
MVADTPVPLCCLLPLLAIGLVTLLYLCESSSLFATHTPSVVGLYHPVPTLLCSDRTFADNTQHSCSAVCPLTPGPNRVLIRRFLRTRHNAREKSTILPQLTGTAIMDVSGIFRLFHHYTFCLMSRRTPLPHS